MRREVLFGTVVLAAAPVGLGRAQETTVLLRYRPLAQAMTRTVSRLELAASASPTDLVGVALPAGDRGDSLTFRVRVQQAFTERVLQAGDRYLVERTLDSVRFETSMTGQAASERTELRPQRAHLLLSDRLEILSMEVQASDADTEVRPAVLRSVTGGYELTLPADPVRPGDEWSAPIQFSFALGRDDGHALASFAFDRPLRATAAFRLDSLVARGRDTLAYVATWGRFDPLNVNQQLDPGHLAGTLTGEFAGLLIWSSAWHAFGSGAIRGDADLRFEATDGERRGTGTMALDMISRFEIRP